MYVVTLNQYGKTYGIGSDDWIGVFAAESDDAALEKFKATVIEKMERLEADAQGTACLIRIDGDDSWTEVRQAEIKRVTPTQVRITE